MSKRKSLVNLVLPTTLADKIRVAASAQNMSINCFLNAALREYQSNHLVRSRFPYQEPELDE